MTIAQRVLYYQIEHRISRKEFAKRIGYSDATIAKWEKGGLPSDYYQCEDLATMLGIDIDELMEGGEFDDFRVHSDGSIRRSNDLTDSLYR